MLHTTYQCYGPCFFRQDNLKSLFGPMCPPYATDQNHLKSFNRGPSNDRSGINWKISGHWFQRCCIKIQCIALNKDDAGHWTEQNNKNSP
jgi:hypothetical protein